MGNARSTANAIQVTCSRTEAKGNAVPLVFAPAVGMSTCDVRAASTAKFVNNGLSGLIGYSAVTFKNNTFVGSYRLSVTTSPSVEDGNAALGSNGVIHGKNNNTLSGNVVMGPSGSVSGIRVSGTTTNQTTAIQVPSNPAWSPGTNPGGVSHAYTVNSDTTLPAGTYWFTSLTVNANFSFSGIATLYVNGDVSVGGAITAYGSVPGNLAIYQLGNNAFGDSGGNGMIITADVTAPGCDFTAKNNLNFYGTGLFNTITTKNNANFWYDEDAGPASGGMIISQVK